MLSRGLVFTIVSLESKRGREKWDRVKKTRAWSNISADRPTKLVCSLQRYALRMLMCHVRENYPLNWTKKERAVRNKNGIRKERSWRKSWRALNGILYAKHAWQFLPSPKRVFFLPVFVVIVKRYFRWISRMNRLFILLSFALCNPVFVSND